MESGGWLKKLLGREGGKYRPRTDSFPPSQVVPQDRTGGDSCPEVDISKIPCISISIPSAKAEQESTINPSNSPLEQGEDDLFGVDVGINWTFTRRQKLTKDERPDPGFDHLLPFNKGFFLCNLSGKAEGFIGAKAVVQIVDNTGEFTVEHALDHDLFRLSSHAEGHILSDLSFYGILRAYDTNLKLLWLMTLTERPELQKRGRELGLKNNETFRWVKDAAVTPDGNHVLLAAIDQVWCLTSSGEVRWGIKCPAKKGWTPEVVVQNTDAVSEPVRRALAVFGLNPPVEISEVKARFRQLARQWHPDVAAPEIADGGERMKAINLAYRVLTGADPEELLNELRQQAVRYRDNASYTKYEVPVELEDRTVNVSIEMGVYVGAAHAADWLACVTFSGDGSRAYAATSSGRVYEIDMFGQALRFYDLATFPYFMHEVGGKLYLGTATHLYVISQGRLLTAVPISRTCKVVVGMGGVLLWDGKQISWLSPDGQKLGCITARYPIRRIRCSHEGWLLETRQHLGILVGPPQWRSHLIET